MSSQSDENQGVVFGAVGLAVVLVIALVIGMGMRTKPAKAPVVAEPVATAPADAAAVSADAASVVVKDGVVKFYFAPAKADVAAGANEALAAVVQAVAAGKKVVVSGFHDASGDPAKNEELSKKRAFAVRDALAALGIAQDKIELKKPENTTAEGPAAEARRVEVTVQ